MDDVKIGNPYITSVLNNFSNQVQKDWNCGELGNNLPVSCQDQNADDFVSETYMDEIIKSGNSHEGFPEVMQSFYGIQPTHQFPEIDRDKWEFVKNYRETVQELNRDLMGELMIQKNTLATIYPPKGFIGWHNNANAPGYNILFTWSETGNGWFKYLDQKTNQIVTIPDVKGWQCKMGYFGSYKETEKLCYHAAYTDCLRITVAYVFGENEHVWEDVRTIIEE